jgi:hypothetical protein
MDAMETKYLLTAVALASLLGAGCWTVPNPPKVAQPFANPATNEHVAAEKGFGKLPKIEVPPSQAKVTVSAVLPHLPPNVTVLRVRRGLPNDTELKNLTNALNIPAAVLGNFPSAREMQLEWRDDQGFRWSYRATERVLEFRRTATSGPLTVDLLKPYDELVTTANSFIFSRGFRPQYYRSGLMAPDWHMWWANGLANGRCMDAETIRGIRGIAASDPLLASSLPALSPNTNRCAKPEFPALTAIRYRAMLDERDVVRRDGSYVNGAEIVVDNSNKAIVSGKINLFYDPERSDYPALTNEQAMDFIKRGGLSGATGEIEISSLEFVFLRVEDESTTPPSAYLIPAALGKGTHLRPDGQTQAYSIVAPLLVE